MVVGQRRPRFAVRSVLGPGRQKTQDEPRRLTTVMGMKRTSVREEDSGVFRRPPTVYRLLPTADAEILATAPLEPLPLVGSAVPRPAVVLVPGFSGTLDRPAVRSMAEGLRWHADVIMIETRGHGR